MEPNQIIIIILPVLANFCRIFPTAYIVEVKHCPKSQDIHENKEIF